MSSMRTSRRAAIFPQELTGPSLGMPTAVGGADSAAHSETWRDCSCIRCSTCAVRALLLGAPRRCDLGIDLYHKHTQLLLYVRIPAFWWAGSPLSGQKHGTATDNAPYQGLTQLDRFRDDAEESSDDRGSLRSTYMYKWQHRRNSTHTCAVLTHVASVLPLPHRQAPRHPHRERCYPSATSSYSPRPIRYTTPRQCSAAPCTARRTSSGCWACGTTAPCVRANLLPPSLSATDRGAQSSAGRC